MSKDVTFDEIRSNSRKGICYIAPDVPIPSPRGSSVHVTELARILGSLGYDVHVICRRTRKEEPNSEKLDGFTVHRVYRFIAWSITKEESVGRSAAETRRDLIGTLYYLYLRTIFAIYVSLVAARTVRNFGMKVILERETAFGAGAVASLLTRRPLMLEMVGPRYSRLSVWRSKWILYYTESMLRRWVNRNKCTEVPGGVNLNLFHEDRNSRMEIRKNLGFGEDCDVIGYVGTFQDWHGIDTLLHALRDLRVALPSIRALLVGPYYEVYEKLATRVQVRDICTFTGPVDYNLVPGYINACDIMVALYEPDRNELRRKYGIGSPLKILEYMACGKPVISTKVNPIERIVQNENTGYLIEPEDEGGIVRAITNLVTDRSKIGYFGANGRKMVEAYFSWESFAKIIRNLLDR